MVLKEKIRAVITDLDGTLLNSEHQISAYTKSIFQQLPIIEVPDAKIHQVKHTHISR